MAQFYPPGNQGASPGTGAPGATEARPAGVDGRGPSFHSCPAFMDACPHPLAQREPLFPARDYVTGDAFEIARCRACGFVVTVPTPGWAAMGRYYPAAYYGAPSARRFPGPVEWLQRVLYARRARSVERCGGGQRGRVLDVGCGRGLLLRAFQRRGWEVLGTEVSETASRFARETLGLPVRIGAVEELELPTAGFDAVVLWHVLEHLADPRPTLREVARLLRAGGVLLVGVPNFGSPEARCCRAGWFHLDVPRHLTHFTPDSLRAALAEAGFEVRWSSFWAPEYDCFSFIQSALNRLGLRHNLLYNLLRGRGAKVVGRPAGAGQALATCLLAPPLGLLSLPVVALAGLLRRGSAMTLLAVKSPS